MCREEKHQVTDKGQETLRTSGGQVGNDIVWNIPESAGALRTKRW